MNTDEPQQPLDVPCWKNKKPCALLNVVGYYDHLNAFMQHGVNQGFIRKETEATLIIKEDPKALLDLFLEN